MNTDNLMWGFFGVCACLGVVRVLRRRRKTYAEYIVPEMKRLGLTVCRIRTTPVFDFGPFPKFEFQVGGIQSETPVGDGEFTEYRIVDAKDSEGTPVTVWCKLEFELFRFKSIEAIPQKN